MKDATSTGASGPPLVSIIMAFYNTDLQFFDEAVRSVRAQTYENWELLLVDDGSEAPCREFAKGLVAEDPGRIHYLVHDPPVHRGASAARQLALLTARGELTAFLDSDDVWMPEKLEEQVPVILQHPGLGMLYGSTLYWYSWTDSEADHARDFEPDLGVPDGGVMDSESYLRRLVEGSIAVPCPCSVIVRTAIARQSGGFDELSSGYDDQRFFVRMAATAPVLAVHKCRDRYRRHADSLCAGLDRSGVAGEYLAEFLTWVETFLVDRRIDSTGVWSSLRRRQWLVGDASAKSARFRRVRKYMLRVEAAILPETLRRRIWPR